jgi:hypothetical protein
MTDKGSTTVELGLVHEGRSIHSFGEPQATHQNSTLRPSPRMYQIKAPEGDETGVSVFRTIEEGRSWLGLDGASPAP